MIGEVNIDRGHQIGDAGEATLMDDRVGDCNWREGLTRRTDSEVSVLIQRHSRVSSTTVISRRVRPLNSRSWTKSTFRRSLS